MIGGLYGRCEIEEFLEMGCLKRVSSCMSVPTDIARLASVIDLASCFLLKTSSKVASNSILDLLERSMFLLYSRILFAKNFEE
jgi:hypothetical protein